MLLCREPDDRAARPAAPSGSPLHARGLPGTIYCSRDTLAEVQAVCHGLEYSVWLATLDGTIPTSVKGGGTLVAVQYEGGPTAEYDVSALLNDTWLHPA